MPALTSGSRVGRWTKLAVLALLPGVVVAQPLISAVPQEISIAVDAGSQVSHSLQLINNGAEPQSVRLSTGPADVADSLHYYTSQPPQVTIHHNVAVRYLAPHDFTLDAASVLVGRNSGVDIAQIEIEIRPVNPAQQHWPLSLEPIGGGSIEVGGAPIQSVQVPLNEPLQFQEGEQFFVLVNVTGGRVARTGSYIGAGSGRQYANGEYGWQIYHFGGWVMAALHLANDQVLTSDFSSGPIPPGGSIEVGLTANAADLIEGTYLREILVTTDGPTNDSLVVPVTIAVTGVSLLELSATELDFGTVVAGQSTTRMLTLLNPGTANLEIASAAFSSSDWIVDPLEPLNLPLTLVPGESATFGVRFIPAEPGQYVGSMVLGSNASNLPQAEIQLSGSAQPAPEITVEPESVSIELTSGESEQRTLTVSNPGEGPLDFTVDRFGNGQGEDTYGYRWTESTEPGGPAFDWVDIRSPETWLDLGSSTFIEVQLPFAFPYYGEEHTSLRVSRFGAVTFLQQYPYFSSLPRPIPMETYPSHFIAPLWKNLRIWSDRGGIYAGMDAEGRFVVQWQELYANANFDSELTFQLILEPTGDILFQYLSISPVPVSSSSFAVGIENHDGSDGLQLAFNDDSFFRNNLAVRIAATPTWIASVEPAAGTVMPGSTQELTATFDPGSLLEGSYQSAITLNSNSPATPRLRVPAHLEVMGVPQTTVEPATLNFGDVFVTYEEGLSFLLSNSGTVELDVLGIDVQGDGFGVVSGGPFSLAPGESQLIDVSFLPPVEGVYVGEVSLLTNDPVNEVTTVALTGIGIGIPEITTLPEALSFSVAAGETQSATLTISNPGDSDLNFSIGVRTPTLAGRELPDGTGSSPVAVDSLVYDKGTADADWMFGLSHTPLSFAVRFTAPYNFSLSALRAYFTTDTSSVNVQVEVFRKGDGPHPSDGQLLASWTLEDLVPEAQWVYIPLPASIPFAPGEEFFAVLHFDHVTFPMGQHYGGPAEYWGRSSYRTGFSQWLTVGPRWLIRALTHGGEFLTMDPAMGVVAPGGSLDVEVTVDGAGMTAGSYSQEMVVMSNDPVAPELTVPVEVTVTSSDGGSANLALGAGWNLVSWNTEVPDDQPGVVLAGILDRVDLVMSYRDGDYVVFKPGAPPGSNTLEAIDPMYSYWIRMLAPGTLATTGEAIVISTPIDVTGGLNAITYLPAEAVAPPAALASVADELTSVMAFVGTGLTYSPSIHPELVTLSQMSPGRGYYLRASGPGTLVYPQGGGNDAGELGAMAPSLTELLEVEAESGVRATMEWMSAWGENVLGLDGTPVPQGTLVTAHTSDGLVVGAMKTPADGRLAPMSIYANDPTTDEKDGADPGEAVTISIGDLELAVIEWTSFGDVIDLSGMTVSSDPGAEEVPMAVLLDANYPNPFSTTTTIRFGIPESGWVRLAVYDALGREVAVLLDDERPTGWHDLRWNASDLASGVYVYQIRAGGHVTSRRMIVVR